MHIRSLLPLFLTAGALAPVPIDEGEGPSATVTLVNGKSAEFTVDEGTIELQTPFGTLSIPLTAVARILHGDHVSSSPAGLDVEGLIEALSDPELAVREIASGELLAIGLPAVPALREAARSADLDVADEAQRLLYEIGVDDPGAGASLDVVTTLAPDMVLRGRILNETYALTDSFSQRQVSIDKIRELSFVPSSMDRRMLPCLLGDAADVANWRISSERPSSWDLLSFNDADWSIPVFHGRRGFAFPEQTVAGSYCLRRTFALDEDVTEAQLGVAGVQSYQVTVNGQAFEGDASGIIDIRHALRAGPNIVAVRYTTSTGWAAVNANLK